MGGFETFHGRPASLQIKVVQRFAKKEGIEGSALMEAIERVEHGQIDANLGGGVLSSGLPDRGKESPVDTVRSSR